MLSTPIIGPYCVTVAPDGSPQSKEPNFPSPPENSQKPIPLSPPSLIKCCNDMQEKLPVLSDVNTETLQLCEHEDADVQRRRRHLSASIYWHVHHLISVLSLRSSLIYDNFYVKLKNEKILSVWGRHYMIIFYNLFLLLIHQKL